MDELNRKPGYARGRGRDSSAQQGDNVGRWKRSGPIQPAIGGHGGASSSRTETMRSGSASTSGSAADMAGGAAAAGGDAGVMGRATLHRNVQSLEQGAGPESGRGAVRGKRIITEIIQSRPSTCATKSGATGTKITLQTNYYRVLKKPQWSIHQYRVDFAPDVDMIRVRSAYLAQHKALFGGYIFDGTIMFCTKHLAQEMNQQGQMELITKNREGETIQIKIKHVGVIKTTDMQSLQVLNLIVRRSMQGLNLQLVGRNYFDALAKIAVPAFQLEIWPGYQTSIRQHESDILLCAEIAHKVMRTESVYNILAQCLRDQGEFQTAFKRQVVGSIVLTDYNNKTYRVDDVDFQSSPMTKFATKDGEITFVEYYQKRYNITIRDRKQPMLVSASTERDKRGGENDFILLIPELARATGLTDTMRANFRLMLAIGEHTRLNPERRIDRLRMFNQRLQQTKESIEVLNAWDLKLDPNLVEVPGRVLPPETIYFANQKTYRCDDRADWTREFRDKSLYTQPEIRRWYVLVPRRSIQEAQYFVKLCLDAARGMRMVLSEPRYEEMNDDRIATYSQALDKAISADPQLVMPVLVSSNEDKYACIKKKCCVDRPVPSQVVTLRVIAPRGAKSSGLMSIATKVVIQMNAKLLGAPWMIKIPLPGLMTVGFDVCHSPKERNTSYGALVASMDLMKSSGYYSSVTKHVKGQELSNDISMKMTYALKAYRDTHGSLPERILFYRDGVGDGQLHQVYETEVAALRAKLDEIYKNASVEVGCRFAFIVVSKRINTRFFNRKNNPVPGTVVDDIVTLPERYDFFLVSQSVRQGTVAPTSYNVLFDTMGLSADRLQMLTYKMTHLYYNWSGTTRVPSVCQYAHKLAFLVAESLHRAPSNVLERQLYFL